MADVTDPRTITMTAEEDAEVEFCIEALMRAGYTDRATAMMNLSLKWRFAKQNEPALPDNVVTLESYSKRVVCT